jgi:hypothetical protein
MIRLFVIRRYEPLGREPRLSPCVPRPAGDNTRDLARTVAYAIHDATGRYARPQRSWTHGLGWLLAITAAVGLIALAVARTT